MSQIPLSLDGSGSPALVGAGSRASASSQGRTSAPLPEAVARARGDVYKLYRLINRQTELGRQVRELSGPDAPLGGYTDKNRLLRELDNARRDYARLRRRIIPHLDDVTAARIREQESSVRLLLNEVLGGPSAGDSRDRTHADQR